MATPHDEFVIFAEESTYATGVAPTRPMEFRSAPITGNYDRIESQAQRAGAKVLRSDRFQPNPKGASGSLVIENLDAGQGFLWKHIMGAIASGTPSGGFTIHTATMGDLKGKSLTAQVARADSAGVLHPFTYEGIKVAAWEVGAELDQVSTLSMTLDAARETLPSGAPAGIYALAVPTYPTVSQFLSYIGGSVTLGGTVIAATRFGLSGDNGLKTDRYGMRGATTTLKREPLEEGERAYTWSATVEFEDKVQVLRVQSLTAAGAIAAGAFHLESPGGGALDFTVPVCRWDSPAAPDPGREIHALEMSGKILHDGSTSPITVAAKTRDATP